jgi:hypothetical protein
MSMTPAAFFDIEFSADTPASMAADIFDTPFSADYHCFLRCHYERFTTPAAASRY